jgi:hypothetical protein
MRRLAKTLAPRSTGVRESRKWGSDSQIRATPLLSGPILDIIGPVLDTSGPHSGLQVRVYFPLVRCQKVGNVNLAAWRLGVRNNICGWLTILAPWCHA